MMHELRASTADWMGHKLLDDQGFYVHAPAGTPCDRLQSMARVANFGGAAPGQKRNRLQGCARVAPQCFSRMHVQVWVIVRHSVAFARRLRCVIGYTPLQELADVVEVQYNSVGS
jgi:hypothetical protein